MKKWIAGLLALALMAGMSACATQDTPDESTEEPTVITEETEPEESKVLLATTAPTEAPDVSTMDFTGYEDLLYSYHTALSEGWSMEQFEEAGLNGLCAMGGTPENIGFRLIDLNGQGTNELLIGAVDQTFVYAMYTLVDGEPVCVFDGGERNTLQILNGNKYYNVASDGAGRTVFTFYAFYGGELQFHDALIYDEEYGPNTPWYTTVEETMNPDFFQEYPWENAQKKIENAEGSVNEMDYVPFSLLEN